MKKLLVVIYISIATLVFADIIGDLQNIDKDVQNKKYDSAINKGKEALKKVTSDDDRRAIESVLNDVQKKIKDAATNVINNLGESIDTENNDELSATDTGTLPSLPSEKTFDSATFARYKKYENQVVATGNSEAIHSLAMMYVREGLYESAMNLALRDKSRSTRNIYLAATAARMIGRFDKSIQLYNELLKRDSGHPKTYLGLAMAYKGKGNYKQALSYLRTYQSHDNSRRIQQDINVLSSH